MEQTFNGLISVLSGAKERIREVKDMPVESPQTKIRIKRTTATKKCRTKYSKTVGKFQNLWHKHSWNTKRKRKTKSKMTYLK